MNDELKSIKESIDAETVSWGEIAFLESHKKEVLEYGDIVLAQWAGIPEEEWNQYSEKEVKNEQ